MGTAGHMNEREQRQHKSRLDELAKATTDLVDGMQQRLGNQDRQIEELRRAIGDERTHRLKMAEEQRRYVDGIERALRDTSTHYFALHSEQLQLLTLDTLILTKAATFWDRLLWLFIGN